MTLYQNTYRVETTRLKSWDYSANGYYFVTICTANRQLFFGQITNSEMLFSDIGLIAKEEWLKSVQLRQNILLDAFVIMPNHIHGIVVIHNPDDSCRDALRRVSTSQHTVMSAGDDTDAPRDGRDAPQRVSTPTPTDANQFGPLKSGSLQSMINGYKGAVTRWCQKNKHPEFGWQVRFWEHIIRNEQELSRIREYIANNPIKWAMDRENVAGVWM